MVCIWKKACGQPFGNILEGCGWTDALTDSEVATSGLANSFLNVSHITRTWHMHQVTAMALAKLQQQAFEKETRTGRRANLRRVENSHG